MLMLFINRYIRKLEYFFKVIYYIWIRSNMYVIAIIELCIRLYDAGI